MGMAAAMIPFAGCQKNEMEDPNAANGGGSTFELVADVVQTKTTLDASTYKVAWENDDVLYVVTAGEGTPWTAAQEFKYADGKFSTESTIDEGNYTMNVLYAASNQKQYHKNTQTTHKIESVQKQDCTNPTVHIKLNDALAGTFTVNVPQTSTAQVDMHHLYTLMQVNVKNNTDNPVEVTKFEMTAEGADLAGIFNVTSFETPSITAKEGEAPTETITVNVTGGVVDAGYALPVYFVMAPLSDYTGDVTFKVTAADGKTYTKTTAVSNLHFNAGAYNTTPYTISEADVVEPEPEQPEGLKTVTISFANTSQRTSHSNDKQVWENDGVVFTNSKGSSTSNVGDYSNPARFYKSSNIEITAPGNITSISFDCTLSDDLESKHITALAGINGAVQDGNSVVITLEGTSNAFTHNGLSAQARANSVTVVYVSNGSVPGTPTPVINVDTTSPIQVEATAGDSSISYTVGNAVDNITVSATSSEKWLKLGTPTNTSVSFSVSENTGAERTATVTLAYEGAESKTVTVKQAAASQGGGNEGGDVEWISTAFADLTSGDQVVIVSTKDGDSYAMSNNNGTGNAPDAVSITYANNKLTSEPAETIVWTVSVDETNYIFHPNGDTAKWLYCTNGNNGVRVGDNTNKNFVLDSETGYLKHIATSRFLGVYLTIPDWRCYTSINDNIKNQTFQFFVKQGGSSEGGESPSEPYIRVSQEVFNVPATQTSVTFDVNANVGWGLEESEGVETQIVGVSDDELVMTVEVTFPANETAEPKTHTVTFIPEELDQNVTVTINQAAKVAVDTNFEAGDYWIIGVEDEISHVMVPFASTSNYAYAPSEVITDNRTFAKYAFTFEAVEGGFNIKASDERYYSTDANYKNFQIKDTPSVWTVSVQNDGTYLITDASTGKTIKYGDSTYTTFGVYTSSDTNTGVYPILVKADNPLPVELTSISVTGYTTIFNEGDPFVFDGIVTANYNDGSTKDVTNSAVVTEPNMVNGAEVTVSYTEGTVTKTFNYNITVKPDSQGGGDEGEKLLINMAIAGNTGVKSADNNSISWTQNDFKCINEKASSSTAIRTSDSDHYRIYKNSILRFTAPSGKSFNTIVVSCPTTGQYLDPLKTSAENAGYTVSVSGKVVTISTPDYVSEISIIASAQFRISRVEVELN